MKMLNNRKTNSIILFVLFSVIYFLTKSYNFEIAHDSAMYVYDLNELNWLFHPHHLLFHPLMQMIYQVNLFLGFSFTSYSIVSTVNLLFGSGALVLVYNILSKNYNIDDIKSMLICLIIGFNYGFWYYSVCVEVYIIPLFFLLFMIYYYQKFILIGKEKDLILVGLFSALACSFHQINFLLSLVIVLSLILNKKITLRNFLLAAIPFSVVLIISYLYAIFIRYEMNSLDSIFIWLFKYTQTEGISFWKPLSLKTPIYVTFGIVRNFFAYHFLLVFDTASNLLVNLFSNFNLNDELFLVRKLDKNIAATLFLFVISYVVLFIFILKKHFKLSKLKEYNRINSVIYMYLLIFSLFFSFWDSMNVEFWIPQVVLLWMIFAISTTNIKKYLLLIIAFVFFNVNYFACISFANNIENNYYYAFNKDLMNYVNHNPNIAVVSLRGYADFANKKMYGLDSVINIALFQSSTSKQKDEFINSILLKLQNGNKIVVQDNYLNVNYKEYEILEDFLMYAKRKNISLTSINNVDFIKELTINQNN